MCLKSWPLETTMFDGDLIAGPFPTLFSEDEDASAAALLADPVKCHWDLMKILRLFFMPEVVSVAVALDLLRKPREGSSMFCFKRPRLTPAILEANRPSEEPPTHRDQPSSPGPGRARSSNHRGRSPSPPLDPASGSQQPPPKRANLGQSSVSGDQIYTKFCLDI